VCLLDEFVFCHFDVLAQTLWFRKIKIRVISYYGGAVVFAPMATVKQRQYYAVNVA